MSNAYYSLDEKNEIVRRVLATENIWETRENILIQRECEEPSVSPINFNTNIRNWNLPRALNTISDLCALQRNWKCSIAGNKENMRNKMDRYKFTKRNECGFCKNNGESSAICTSHRLKDEHGRVVCPRLRRYVCPNCGSTGDNAHTIKYCPNNPPTLPELWRL